MNSRISRRLSGCAALRWSCEIATYAKSSPYALRLAELVPQPLILLFAGILNPRCQLAKVLAVGIVLQCVGFTELDKTSVALDPSKLIDIQWHTPV